MSLHTRWDRRFTAYWLISGICAAVLVLAWFSYTAGGEWRRNADLLVTRRAEETADRVARALVRDMRGVQEKVLRGLPSHWITQGESSDIVDVVATAFARYPYPESFFAWSSRGGRDGGELAEALFFTRVDRAPSWLPGLATTNPFPVVTQSDAALSHELIGRAAKAAVGRPFVAFHAILGGEPYQVIANLVYRTSRLEQVDGMFGFLVNLRWARDTYLQQTMKEFREVFGTGDGLLVSVEDHEGIVLAGTEIPPGTKAIAARRVKPIFFDPALVALGQLEGLSPREWTIRVSAAADPAYAFALRGADRTFTVTTIVALAFGFGLLLTARALRASADLAQLRADFVSSVTHELKTPLSTIRAVGDALASGRISGVTDVRDYAQIVDQESKRLTRLLDNLLAYARVTDVGEVYRFEPLVLSELLDDVIRRFQPQFAHRGFDVRVDIPPDLPPVAADHTALELVFDNLVDNAMRYSGDQRSIWIWVDMTGAFARIAICDRGVGIPSEQLGRVDARFVRVRRVGVPGSGLGLAIARRIVRDHNGRLEIVSEEGRGTTVYVHVPVFREAA